MEALTGFSHVYHPASLNNALFSQGCVLENSSHYEQSVFSKDREGVRSLQLPMSSLAINQESRPLHDLFQHMLRCFSRLPQSPLLSCIFSTCEVHFSAVVLY